MSLKDVIMTLNDFYSTKLDSLHQVIYHSETLKLEVKKQELEKTEKVIKDNEVRIPYDEEIFIGIDKNYKILKKTLNVIKERWYTKPIQDVPEEAPK